MKPKLLVLPFILLVAALAIAGCGDDDEDAGDDGGSEPTASAPADGGDDGGDDDDGDSGDDDGDDSGDDDRGSGGGGGGPGTATLTVGDVTYEFDDVDCGFSADEGANPSFPFNLAAFSEVDGRRTQLSADIHDPSGEERHEGEGVTHTIRYNDIDDFENPVVSWTTFPGDLGGGEDAKLTVDGKHISGVGSFDDGTTDEFEAIEGTLEVDCP